jgi:hypothetical protein
MDISAVQYYLGLQFLQSATASMVYLRINLIIYW